MGLSAKLLKWLIGQKLNSNSSEENVGGNKRRAWKLLWSSSAGCSSSASAEGIMGGGGRSSTSDISFSAAAATVIRARPRDFKLLREEYAAIRIQSAFRSFMAKRALRALKALVRLQAIFRGRRVRKQVAATLRCVQALVRAQDRIRAQSLQATSEDQAGSAGLAEGGWCHQEGAIKRVQTSIPNYMSPTASSKARKRAHKHPVNPSPLLKTRRSADSHLYSMELSKDSILSKIQHPLVRNGDSSISPRHWNS